MIFDHKFLFSNFSQILITKMSIETKGFVHIIHDSARKHIEQYDRDIAFKMAEITRFYALRNFEQQLLATTNVNESRQRC